MSTQALEQGEGILRLAPTWVPRSFCIPGKRIKLHPADTYAFGAHRGGIDERWLASTTMADNGPLTSLPAGVGCRWFVPAGVSHAPGSYCTQEPRWASDVFAMFQTSGLRFRSSGRLRRIGHSLCSHRARRAKCC